MLYQNRQSIIIGAGIGGLATAIRLATRGHHVRIIERLPTVGGKLNLHKMQGFSFDTGPSLLTMPAVLHELFQDAGRHLEAYLDLVPLEITCRYFYRDGVILNAWRDHTRLAQEFARLDPHDGAAFWRFLAYARNIYQAAADPFLYHSLGNPLSIANTFINYILHGHAENQLAEGEGQLATTQLERLQAVQAALSAETLDQCVRRFFHDPHLHQLFNRYATYNGSSPYQIGSVYSIIPYVELADGGWYPRGGMYTLAQALEQLARELGVEIETGCAVQRVLVEHGEARGVVLADGRVLRGDTVIANSDVVTTQRELLSPATSNQRTTKRLASLEPSCSGFVLLLGLDKHYPQLSHHNIFFSDDYHAEFEDLFTYRRPLRNPTIYICATTRTDDTQAPPGHENLFVLVNAPYLTSKSDWQRDAPTYRAHILALLASYTQLDLSDLHQHIVCEAMITPTDFQQRYASNAGSIYGLSSNAKMAPFTRPGNRSHDIKHLYFVGGSTHPGGGIPLVMLSAKIVADMIETD